MLKITVTETPTEQRWVLEGRLTRPWVTAVRVGEQSMGRAGASQCDGAYRFCVLGAMRMTSMSGILRESITVL